MTAAGGNDIMMDSVCVLSHQSLLGNGCIKECCHGAVCMF
jgi:hypothetical protein